MSWWNPFSWGKIDQPETGGIAMPPPLIIPGDSPAKIPEPTVPKPKPEPEPFDPDNDIAKHIVFTVFRHAERGVRIGVKVPSTIHGGSEIFDMPMEGAALLVLHLERALLAAEAMEGLHDDMLDEDEPDDGKDKDPVS